MKVLEEFDRIVGQITRDYVRKSGNFRGESNDAVYLSRGYWWSPGHIPGYLTQERGEDFAEKDAEALAMLVGCVPELLELLKILGQDRMGGHPALVALERKILMQIRASAMHGEVSNHG